MGSDFFKQTPLIRVQREAVDSSEQTALLATGSRSRAGYRERPNEVKDPSGRPALVSVSFDTLT